MYLETEYCGYILGEGGFPGLISMLRGTGTVQKETQTVLCVYVWEDSVYFQISVTFLCNELISSKNIQRNT